MTVNGIEKVPTDRMVIRLVVAAAVVITAAAGTSGKPWWAAVCGLLAAATVAAAMIAAVRVTWCVRRPILVATVLVAGTSVASATLGASTIWMTYLGIIAAATAPARLLVSGLGATIPLAVLAIRTYSLSHTLWSPVVNVAIGIGLFVLITMRRRQREADELAAAQRAIIENERARALDAQQRAHLAGQLHDVLAHTLSGLIITLQGATMIAHREQVSEELSGHLATATALARDGLAEARSAVDSLRSTTSAAAVSHLEDDQLESWFSGALQQHSLTGGAPIEVIGSVGELPPEWGMLVRSAIQEGLTNSRRHAAGTPIRITLEPEGVRVDSVGTPASFVDLGHPSGGHGIAGLRDRIVAVGGQLDAGQTDAGFTLAMRFPRAHRVDEQ